MRWVLALLHRKIANQDIMDPTDSCRIVEPCSLKPPPDPLPFKAPSRILPPGVHPNPVSSLVGNEAHFHGIERLKLIGNGGVGTVSTEGHPIPVNSLVGSDYFSEIERLEHIGSGTVGSVYKAVHRPSGRLHAIKVISGWPHDCRWRILQGIGGLEDVDEHPNVVSFRGVRDSCRKIQVLLDYVDGRSLVGVHIQDEQRLSRLTLQILSGLAHLHERKVVHQNINPSNLLVDSLGNVKITDWVARIVGQSTGRGSSCRISAYTSPERTGVDYDGCAVDIWSLGICILEIYLGSSPYARGKQLERDQLAFKIIKSEPPRAPPTASMEFRDFISCCLQKDLSKRWTAAQLLGHPFILQHNHQQQVGTELTEPSLGLAVADFTNFDLNPSLAGQQAALSVDKSLNGIILEAQHRWLEPAEILQILQNYEKFELSKKLLHRPPTGSMCIFNRRVVRRFRHDGHDWEKKKDGRTVAEACELIKVGTGEKLRCFYSQGLQNPNFRRRCYWVLDKKLEHIVLVHYREAKEGKLKSISSEDSASMSHSTITCDTNISLHFGPQCSIYSREYDTNISLHLGPQDSSCKPSSAEYGYISQRETCINYQNERTEICPTSYRDQTQHLDSQCNTMQTECSERFGDELASMKLPTCRDWEGWVTSLHGAEECRVEDADINDQDQRDDVSMLSEDNNPEVIRYEEDKSGMMLMRSISDDDDVLRVVEELLRDPVTDHIETDSCYTDSDSDDASVTRGQKHQKLKVSQSFKQIPNPTKEFHTRSSPSAASEDQCLQIEMPTSVNGNSKKTEVLRGCAQIDDIFNWELLHQKMGEVVHPVEIQTIAKQIVRACGNDFHSLTLMSRALSSVSDIETWEYALDNLSLQHASCLDESKNIQVNVLKFSIELLEDDLTRECLTSLALRSKNIEVARASLIDSWIREGMLDTHSEGEKVIKNLLDAKLLELSENGELVKFLNLDQHVLDLVFQPEASGESLMQGGLGLVEPPEVGEWERAKEICLMHNDLSELPECPRCPSLSTLFLQRNHKLRTIPSSFFSHMPSLEVLNLSKTRIKSLPDSLFELVSLKRLFLNECILLRTLSPKVGGLKNLEVLDLEGTKLTGLPEEIRQLIKLTCLEVSVFGEISKVTKQINASIPSGALSALSFLEELNIDVGPEAKWWDSYAEGLIDEICSLERLTGLKFYFPKVEPLRKFSVAYLTHFRIVVGRQIGRIMSRLPNDIEFELERWDRYLRYIYGEDILEVEDVMKVLKHADAFFLDRHTNLKKLSDFGKENLEQLRCCVLGECNELQVLIDAEDFKGQGDKITLGSLEYLYVYYMKNLETIWRGPVQEGSLSCLKSLTLRTCPKVTSIFTQELLENLCNLEELTVEDCPTLISLVSYKHSANSETSHCLPVLKKLSLHYLPELTSISSGQQVAPMIEWLSFYDCPNLKSLDLSLQEVKRIRGQRIWWEGLEWNGDCPSKLGDIFNPITACAVP